MWEQHIVEGLQDRRVAGAEGLRNSPSTIATRNSSGSSVRSGDTLTGVDAVATNPEAPVRTELEAWRSSGHYFRHDLRRIFYAREGSGAALLLIHGYPFNSYDWHRIWPELTASYDVIAPDMLGMGFSDKPIRHNYSVIEHADMHEELLRSLGIDDVVIIAHDIGVSVAQEMLARRLTEDEVMPRINGVVFLNGGLFHEAYRPRIIQKLLSSPLGHIFGPMMPDFVVKPAIRELFGPDTKPSAADMAGFIEVLKYGNGRFVSHLVGRFIHERQTYRDRWAEPLERGSVPIRLINGALDPNSGAHMTARYREIAPNPDIVSLEVIGHWPQLEAPKDVVEAALPFLQAHARRSAR